MEQEEILIKEVKKFKKLTLIFIIISIILAILLLFSLFNVRQIVVEKENSMEQIGRAHV